MWRIPKTNISGLETFEVCIDGVTTPGLQRRLRAIRSEIVDCELAFDHAATTSTTHEIAPVANVGDVTAEELVSLYDRHMARAGSRGRATYDRLMIAAENDICPFCGHRTVSTLDHSLPKSNYPGLAVTPVNLVPCCKDCNHAKGSRLLTDATEQLLNPYYDDVVSDRWLYAEIVEGAPPAATFFVTPAANWSQLTTARVNNHFTRLKLARLYASQAGRQIQNMRRALGEIYDGAGIAAVREDLERRLRSCEDVTVNSWEGALYRAAAANDWYCDGGFRSA